MLLEDDKLLKEVTLPSARDDKKRSK